MSEMAPEPTPVTRVARDLTAILDLYAQLPGQAIADSADHLMPGGRAMVALGPVASLEAWENLEQATERYGKAYTFVDLEDAEDVWEAFQLINYWSEAWRIIHGADYGQRPTLASEINFIRYQLGWAWDRLEPAEWDKFAENVRNARAKLEDITKDGKRSLHGVLCLDCSVDLVRDSRAPRRIHYCDGNGAGFCVWPHRFCPHDRGGLSDTWKCPSCERRYDHEAYLRAVHHAHFIHATYLPIGDAASRCDVKAGTIVVWAWRGKVRKQRPPGAERTTYCVADIEAARDEADEVA